jgi:HTH-type transcriptional regulator / antitoxin HipB
VAPVRRLYAQPHNHWINAFPYNTPLYGNQYIDVICGKPYIPDMASAIRTQKQLGAELRRRRKQHNLSQGDLGRRINKRQATISGLESSGNGTLDTLFAVLSALDLEIAMRPRSKGELKRLEDIF